MRLGAVAVAPQDRGAFTPAAGLANRHAQTIYPALFRRGGPRSLIPECWPVEDGALDMELLPDRPGRPGVLVLHGLEGSSRARYVRGLLAAVEARSWNGAAYNFRSCGPTRSTRLYHSGDTHDLPFVVRRLVERWGGPLAVVGFSMGGNVLLKWLGEEGDRAAVATAVAVSVPFDLGVCARALDGPGFFPAIYRRRFLRTLRRKAVQLAHTGVVDARVVRRCRTFHSYDTRVTAPLFGYADAADYWRRNSSAAFLHAVRRPALLVLSQDDPLVPLSALPREVIAANPALTLWLTERGGHVGFVAGSIVDPVFAAEERALAFLERHLS